MEISKLKQGGLLFKAKNADFVIDPAINDGQPTAEAPSADFALSSTPALEAQNYHDQARLFSWPGEYEVKGVAVHAYPTAANDKNTQNPLLFIIYTDDSKICYIPEIKEELHSDLIEEIGGIDLLVFPAAGSDKVWHATLEEIEPKAILPIIDEKSTVSIDAFLAKIGLVKPEPLDKITLKNVSDLRSDQIVVFLLA